MSWNGHSHSPIVDAAQAALASSSGNGTVTRATLLADDRISDVYCMLVDRSIAHAKANEDGLSVTGEVNEILLRGLLVAAQRACDTISMQE